MFRQAVKQTFELLWKEWKIWLVHYWDSLVFKLKRPRPRKLHLGSGQIILSGFCNIDIIRKADCHFDLRRKLPINSYSVDYIFSEHSFEHFNYPYEITNLFSECYRILKKAGLMEFSIPNYEKVIKSYFSDKKIFHICKQDYQKIGFVNKDTLKSENDYLDLLLRQGGEHKYLYDFATIKRLLKQCGFSKVAKRKPGNLDSLNRRAFSLYITCKK